MKSLRMGHYFGDDGDAGDDDDTTDDSATEPTVLSGQGCSDCNGVASSTDANGNCIPVSPCGTAVDLTTVPGTPSQSLTSTGQLCNDCNGNPAPIDANGNCTADLSSCGGVAPAAPSSSTPSWLTSIGTTLLNDAAKAAPGLIASATGAKASTTTTAGAKAAAAANFFTTPIIPGTPITPLLIVGVGAGVTGIILMMRKK